MVSGMNEWCVSWQNTGRVRSNRIKTGRIRVDLIALHLAEWLNRAPNIADEVTSGQKYWKVWRAASKSKFRTSRTKRHKKLAA
jgi:hypothetical protein